MERSTRGRPSTRLRGRALTAARNVNLDARAPSGGEQTMQARVLRFLITLVVGLSSTASAQTGSSSIAGVARDQTGAALPGVTVEASSPALIEKVKSTVTNEAGEYEIVDLRAGMYNVA